MSSVTWQTRSAHSAPRDARLAISAPETNSSTSADRMRPALRPEAETIITRTGNGALSVTDALGAIRADQAHGEQAEPGRWPHPYPPPGSRQSLNLHAPLPQPQA